MASTPPPDTLSADDATLRDPIIQGREGRAREVGVPISVVTGYGQVTHAVTSRVLRAELVVAVS